MPTASGWGTRLELRHLSFFHFHDTSYTSALRTNARFEDDRFLRSNGSIARLSALGALRQQRPGRSSVISVYAVVEGATEERYLASGGVPHLANRSVFLYPMQGQSCPRFAAWISDLERLAENDP